MKNAAPSNRMALLILAQAMVICYNNSKGGVIMKKNTLWVILTAVVCCGLMALVDGVIQPGYAVKSAIKIGVFLLIPFLLSRLVPEVRFREVFHFSRKGVLLSFGLGTAVYGLILGGYFLLRDVFDFSNIVDSLTSNAGVSRKNFLYVSLYISFVNSLLEEFFFRGFLFTNLTCSANRGLAYGFSATAFALYHVAMMLGWFSPVLFLLVMVGLTAGGVIFNYLNEKLDTLFASWIVHMFANFAINTIGLILMG